MGGSPLVSVYQQLAGYISLQRLLDRRAALRRERETPPPELLALRTQFGERTAQLGASTQRRDELKAEHTATQREAEELREERDHFRKQKSQVINMKQLSAVVSELDHVESRLKAKEDRLLEIWEELERLEAEIAQLSQETPEEREQREVAEKAWDDKRAESEEEYQKVESEMRLVQRQLGPEAMKVFKKLWSAKKPNAVVPLDGTACSACHAELRPSLYQLVRAIDGLQHCDSCRRLLYDPEKFPVA